MTHMPRLIRRTAILAKIESEYGKAPADIGAQDAMLISDASIEFQYNNVSRELLRDWLGASEELVGTRSVKLDFTVELAASGEKGRAPAWAAIVRGCGMGEKIIEGQAVEYRPLSSGFPSLTIDYYLDGVRYRALGCRGTFSMSLAADERPTLKCTFTGLDGGAQVSAHAQQDFSAWRTPHVVTHHNSAGVVLGCTYEAGALSGGTRAASRGLSLDLGHEVQHIALLGGSSIAITARATTGTMSLELDAAAAVAAMQDINQNQTQSLGFEHGTAHGQRIVIFSPRVQRINPKTEDFNGVALQSFDLRFMPGDAGNDDVVIVCA